MEAEDSLKHEIEQSKMRLQSKLCVLENVVQDRLENVKDRAQGIYDNLKADVRRLSPVHLIQKRPLIALGVAVAVGMKVGYGRTGRTRRSLGSGPFVPEAVESVTQLEPSSFTPNALGRESKRSPVRQMIKQMLVKFGASYLKKKFPAYQGDIGQMEGEFLARFAN